MKKVENIHTEYKQSWRDEYIKWICAFANAEGGFLYIGIDDRGSVTGINNAKQLLEEIPNKVRDVLGIIVSVKLKTKTQKSYLIITVEAHHFPISYKGQYFVRTGSTKQELKGASLHKFLLGKQGKQWDSVIMSKPTLASLSSKNIAILNNEATTSGRLNTSLAKSTSKTILENLNLVEGKLVKRAAVLLFYPQPEQYINGAFVRLAFFDTKNQLVFQDEVLGTLYEQVTQTMHLIFTKYLKATIKYEGIKRVESFPFPLLAIREALLNAIVHKDYDIAVHIQIKITASSISIFNPGQLPETWTVDKLYKEHPSMPYNPLISRAFFYYGLIETWGTGIDKIVAACKIYSIPNPSFILESMGLNVTFTAPNNDTNDDTNDDTNGDTNDDTNSDTNDDTDIAKLIIAIIAESPYSTVVEMAAIVKKSRITVLRQLDKMKEEKLIKRMGNNKTGYWKITKKGMEL